MSAAPAPAPTKSRKRLVEIVEEDDEPVVTSQTPAAVPAPAPEEKKIIATVNAAITLKDVLFGVDKRPGSFNIRHTQECKTCQSSGEIQDMCRFCRGQGITLDAEKEPGTCGACQGRKQLKMRCENCTQIIKILLTVPSGAPFGHEVVCPVVSEKDEKKKEFVRVIIDPPNGSRLFRSKTKPENVIAALKIPLEQVLQGQWSVVFKDVEENNFTFESDPSKHRGETLIELSGKGLPVSMDKDAKRGNLILSIEPVMPLPSWFTKEHNAAIDKLFA